MENKNKQSEPVGKTTEKDSPIMAAKDLPANEEYCYYGNDKYSNGAWKCIDGLNHLCVRGTWVHYNEKC